MKKKFSLLLAVLSAAAVLCGCTVQTLTYSSSSSSAYSSPVYTPASSSRPIKDYSAQPVLPDPPSVEGFEPVDPAEYYGRSMFTGSMLTAYDAIAEGVAAHSDRIEISGTVSCEQFEKIMLYYTADYPQHFWLGDTYTLYVDAQGNVTAVEMDYLYSAAAAAVMQARLQEAVNDIFAGISADMSDYEKELALHDSLVRSCSYDESMQGENIYNAYGAIVEGSAVCQGYSKAMQLLLRQAGIHTLFVRGESRGQGHAWNVVEIDGEYYHLDATWNDPITVGEESSQEGHSYFNLTTDDIGLDHTISSAPDENYPLPPCTADAANYFIVEGLEFSSVTQGFYEPFRDLLIEAGRARKSDVTIRFSRNFEENCRQLVEGGILLSAMEEAGSYYDVNLDTTRVGISRNEARSTVTLSLYY